MVFTDTSWLDIRYQEGNDFAMNILVLAILAFAPDNYVLSCYNFIMRHFPEEPLTLAKYFKNTY